MYAVFESGGKQHRVAEGDVIRLELIESEAGSTLDFDKVLLVKGENDLKVGAPFVEGGKVSAEVLTHGRAAKVKIVKFRRRKHSRTQMGHRQWYTEVKITSISA